MSATSRLSGESLAKLLAALGPDREKAGERYETIRKKLVRIFEWRGAAEPEALADETIDRVARRLSEGVEITGADPAPYFQGAARLVFLESLRDPARNRSPLGDVPAPADRSGERAASERRSECLDQCLDRLPPDSRSLVLRYYTGDQGARIENRRLLAEEHRISLVALRIRAHRLREKLEACVGECLRRGPA